MNFKQVLDIKDLESETIFDVIGRMEVLLEYFESKPKYKNLVPFLQTYYLITKEVAEKRLKQPHFFHNLDLLSKLDVYFANLYFRPLKVYLESGRMIKPWQNYFRYCKQKNGLPFLQMFLGMNAHINADLAISLKEINYKEKKDFLAVSKILHEEIPAVMKFLAFKERDYYVLGGYFVKGLIEQEFRKVVVSWRLKAWTRASSLTLSDNTSKQQTERIARQLIDIFAKISFFKDWREVANEINNLKIT